MFALLGLPSPAGSSSGAAGGVTWHAKRRITPASPCAQPLSFIDTLAAPTVFIEQALVFQEALAAEALAAALAAVVEACPGIAATLHQAQVSCVKSDLGVRSGGPGAHPEQPRHTHSTQNLTHHCWLVRRTARSPCCPLSEPMRAHQLAAVSRSCMAQRTS
jgi:hypothetical protein